MTTQALGLIAQRLRDAGVAYSFMRWQDQPPAEAYFVGEYLETPTAARAENGHQESTFILRGFTRGSWLSLENAKATAATALPCKAIFPDGSGIAITYDSATPVPTSDGDIKSIKIDFSVDEWSVT